MKMTAAEFRKQYTNDFSQYDVVIGIDPGVNCGVALRYYSTLQTIETMSFWGCVMYLDKCFTFHIKPIVVIEDPNLNRPTFNKKGVSVGEVRKINKISQNVGMNKMMATLLIEYCELKGIPVKTVRPKTAKWTAEALKQYTGYTGKTSQHARDAAKLIF